MSSATHRVAKAKKPSRRALSGKTAKAKKPTKVAGHVSRATRTKTK